MTQLTVRLAHRPPRRSRAALHSYLSRLRVHLRPGTSTGANDTLAREV